MQLTYVIPDEKVTEYVADYVYVHKNTETIQDPNADPAVDTPIAKYTDAQWVREQVRRIIVRDIRRGLQMSANEAAQVAGDDGMVT